MRGEYDIKIQSQITKDILNKDETRVANKLVFLIGNKTI